MKFIAGKFLLVLNSFLFAQLNFTGSYVSSFGDSQNDFNYEIIVIDDSPQEWSENYLYPILPKLNKFGVFDDDVNVETSYGNASIAPITNIDETDNNLLLDVDFNQNDTDDLIDKTDINKIEYNQDFQLSLDENLRLQIDTLMLPDGIETEKSEQAF